MENEADLKWNDILFKRDVTRLKKLLKGYRDHMITTRNLRIFEDSSQSIEIIDHAIETIIDSL